MASMSSFTHPSVSPVSQQRELSPSLYQCHMSLRAPFPPPSHHHAMIASFGIPTTVGSNDRSSIMGHRCESKGTEISNHQIYSGYDTSLSNHSHTVGVQPPPLSLPLLRQQSTSNVATFISDIGNLRSLTDRNSPHSSTPHNLVSSIDINGCGTMESNAMDCYSQTRYDNTTATASEETLTCSNNNTGVTTMTSVPLMNSKNEEAQERDSLGATTRSANNALLQAR